MGNPVPVSRGEKDRPNFELPKGPKTSPRVSKLNRVRFSERLLILTCVCFIPRLLVAQIAANGQQLTVTTANTVATFQGPDLVGLTNTLTGESYLKSPSATPLMNLETLAGPSYSLQASTWTGGGATSASLTMQDSVRAVTIAVTVDPASQEIVITLSGQTTQPGATAAYWAIAGLDMSAGHLIVPASSGIVLDQQHLEWGSMLVYPSDWQAQMAVYETSVGSMVLYSTDSQYLRKQLRVASRTNPTIDLSVATEAIAPWPSATSVPTVEWRLKSFAGDWRTAAAVYRDWLAANRPPVSNSNHAWVNNIRTVIQVGSAASSGMIQNPSILDTLAAELTPSQTLIYIPNWRQSAYDVNYPDYTPASGVVSFVAKAHTLGFKVMLHTDLVGVTPSNADFASVQQWQLKDPGTLQLMGSEWSSPASTPNRFAFIDPASSVFRKLFISRVGAAVAAVQPDALHLDTSSYMFNDGNGPIEGMNYAQGVVQLHKDLIAAFPNLALGGEGTNDAIYAYNSFAQNAWSGDYTTLLGHPIASFLWNSQTSGQTQIQYYGHLGQPAATDPNFKSFVALVEREGILPVLVVNGASDLDLTNADNARLLHWLESWQANGFQPAWSGDWTGSLIPYQGVSGATATLSDSGSVISLNAGGTPLYQRIHDSMQQVTAGYIANWPAFDATQIYGLDPSEQYWLDPIPRPATTHITSLPAGVQVGSETMVSPSFAYVELAGAQPFDFFDNLWDAQIGITYNGTDGPLAYGAMVQILTTTAGGVARQGIFMPPPGAPDDGGETFVEWPVPVSQASAFLFSVGVADSAGTCTDGVTFRIVVNGAEAWRQNVLHQGWVNGSVDLSAYAGTTAQLRIVTNPGPANNPNCDWASFSDLSLVSLGSATTSVPLVLAPASTVSGFSGSGTFSASGPSAGTVSGVPVPGQFVLFLASGTLVSAGTSLTGLPFATWLGGEGQLPVPGTPFNSNLSFLPTGSVSTAISGGVTKQNAIFALPPNEGRAILSWTLALPSTSNLQLGWSIGMGDGCPSDTGVQFSVRINGVNYWTDFQQTAAGWNPGGLDLTNWQGQNALLQLVTDSVGDNGCDWAWWADLTISQSGAACSISAPSGASIASAGGSGSLPVTAGPNCPWSATTNVTWILIASSASGTGSGTVSYTVLPNAGAARTGTITTAGQTFTIEQESSPPGVPTNPSPSNGATGVTLTPTLSWTGGSAATSYDVYFGTSSSPPLVVTNTTGTSYAPGTLDSDTTYYWQIVAQTSSGPISSAIWSFTAGSPAVGLRFVPVTPCRIADTRNADGPFGGPTLGTADTRSFAVPQSACNIPNTALAYSLNVTVVPEGFLGYLALWPTGQSQPTVSTLNSYGGTVVANAAIVPAGTGGAVSVYVTNPTDVILDINGYFDTSTGATSYSFYPATPCRVADTRNATGQFGGPTMQANQIRDFPIPQSSCDIPATARAYSLNITVVPEGFLGYLATWPTGQQQPNVSTLNSYTGSVVANAALVPAGTNEAISVFVTNPTDVIADINGYFGQPGSAGALSFYPVTPCRVADTRNANGPFGGPIMGAGETRSFTIPASACGIPATAAAYSLNVTVVPEGALYYLSVWPTGVAQPVVSTLNSYDGSVLANAAIVPAGTGGAIDVYVTGQTHVILDINGYFAP